MRTLLGNLLDWYQRLSRLEKLGVWGSLASIIGLTPWVLSLVRKARARFNRNKLPTGIFHIEWDKRFDSGWITSAKSEDIEEALRNKSSYMVPVELRSRWWVTNRSTREARITDVYFQSVRGERRNRERCEFWFLSPEEHQERPAAFENTAYVEVNLWSDSSRLDKDQSDAGYVVFVDQMGNEYRTEPLLWDRESLKELRR